MQKVALNTTHISPVACFKTLMSVSSHRVSHFARRVRSFDLTIPYITAINTVPVIFLNMMYQDIPTVVITVSHCFLKFPSVWFRQIPKSYLRPFWDSYPLLAINFGVNSAEVTITCNVSKAIAKPSPILPFLWALLTPSIHLGGLWHWKLRTLWISSHGDYDINYYHNTPLIVMCYRVSQVFFNNLHNWLNYLQSPNYGVVFCNYIVLSTFSPSAPPGHRSVALVLSLASS